MTNTAESTINLFARRSRVINGPSGSGCGGVYSFSFWEEDEEDEEIEDETLLVRLFLDVDKKFPLRVKTGGLLSLFLSSPPPPPRRRSNENDDGNVALFPIIIFFFFCCWLSLFFFARERERREKRE